MIISVTCDHSSFKDVHFQPGFNVVLADRTKESTIRDTRNGLGKSTLIEIIHFCLGASPDVTLKDEHVYDWTFTITLQLAGQVVIASRNTATPNRVTVEADPSDWKIKPKLNSKTEEYEFSVAQWNGLLGSLMFGISPDEESVPFKPAFRGLIAYFIRRGVDAYSDPFENHRKQKEPDIQALNAFLLQLDWSYATEWQQLKEKEKLLNDLKKGAKLGVVENMLGGTLGDLEAQRVRLEVEVQQEREQLDSFLVHPQYREIEKRANQLTTEIHELENQNFSDSRQLEAYKKSIENDVPPSGDDLLKVYEEATVVLPETVKKRFDDVQEFHNNLIKNRQKFLESEIDRLSQSIERRRADVVKKSEEKAEYMQVLNTHGALEEYTRLQQLHTRTVSQLHEIEQRIQNLKRFERGKSEVAIEKQLLGRRARTDLDERHAQVRKAIALFNENSQALYESPGTLAIDIAPTGYKFHINIERSKSEGIGNMKVFCYDLMLAQLWAQKQHKPGFLVHDSTIFDGVDERQRALALELAHRESERWGFQYICMLNSDMLPEKDFSDGFNIERFVRLRLTDATSKGGLLGVRF
jgi:uncharacterized protein YydD (DUF2326 family)